MQLDIISLHADYNFALEKHETEQARNCQHLYAIIFMVIDPEEITSWT